MLLIREGYHQSSFGCPNMVFSSQFLIMHFKTFVILFVTHQPECMNAESPKETILTTGEILVLASRMKQSSVLNLLQFETLYRSKLQSLLSQSPAISSAYTPALSQLCSVLQKRTNDMLKLKSVYPWLSGCLDHIKSLLDFRFVEAMAQPPPTSETPQDKVFQLFLDDERYRRSRPDHPAPAYEFEEGEERKPMHEYISRQQFPLEWQPIFAQARHDQVSQRGVVSLGDNQMNLRDLQYPKMNVRHLCCSEFIYSGQNINVAGVTETPLSLIGSALLINNNKPLILRQICAMLNHGGGVCLFDCQQQYLEVLPVGAYLTQHKKEGIVSQLDTIFKLIHPNITFGVEADLQFVPIAKNVYSTQSYQLLTKMKSKELAFEPAKYVGRLKIIRRQAALTYFVTYRDNLQLYVRGQNGLSKQVTGIKKARHYKRQFNKFYAPESLSPQEKAFLFPPVTPMTEHTCHKPLLGLPCNQKQKKTTVRVPKIYQIQQQFNYISLVCLNRINPGKLMNYLRPNFRRMLIVEPSDNNGAISNPQNIHILLHDKKLKQIRPHIEAFSIKDTMKDRIPVKPFMLMVEPILKVGIKLQNNQFEVLLDYIQSQYQTQKLIYYHDTQQNKFYLETHYRVSAFYIYLWFEKIRQPVFFQKVEVFRLKKQKLVMLMNSEEYSKFAK